MSVYAAVFSINSMREHTTNTHTRTHACIHRLLSIPYRVLHRLRVDDAMIAALLLIDKVQHLHSEPIKHALVSKKKK